MSSELATRELQPKTVEHVRAELERSRVRVAVAAEGLRQDFSRATRWTRWVGQHPYPALLGAVALGIWLGSYGRRK